MKVFIGILITILCVPFLLSKVRAAEPVPTCDRTACDTEYDCIFNRCGSSTKTTTCKCLPLPSSTKKKTYCGLLTDCPVPTPACILPVIEDYFSLAFSKISSPDVDIIFAFDTTGSMRATINTAQSVGNVLLEGLDNELGNRARFGIVDFRDYTVNGYGMPGTDYPYKLVVDLTDDKGAVKDGIDELSIGNGGDGQESYLRVMYEAYSTIKWREDSKKVLVFLGDSIEHDPDLPPREGGNKISTKEVVAKFKDQGISLLYLDVSTHGAVKHWETIAEDIGNGSGAFLVNPDKEEDFVKEVTDRIIGVVRKIKEVYLKVYAEKYIPWVIYEKLDGLKIPSEGMEYRFPYKILPIGVSINGNHNFVIKLYGDKTKYAEKKHTVQIKCDGSYPTPSPVPTILPTFTPAPTGPISTPRPRDCDMCKVINKVSDKGTKGGDYNCDNVVNIGDYSIWRKEFVDKITKDGHVMSDGNCDGVSDSGDYSAWRNNFIK